ncbi:class I SAM-dependent DNA methyltransferase [Flavobacterium salilacus subsp. salilacus]|uniref:class I SAM-dependent DNA methyltransferase n=1 Tax=Flavobacterium TaxID=237 RepID=UPI001074E5DB|nr:MULTISPECIES: DNA methyltransferase [Flavobacterium]KAF2519438.1 class I SAM-dependent DNA methyltransferase [Flavobacterium salilacus subsp. salilacus]MBE1614670.1 class I SAM-dependent DNA methyltransferase [Flavobacterium sp. SaA2.13]
MALSWNEIKDRAVRFAKEWENDFNENAEAKSFMDAFFNVFGIPRRRVATFEQHVKKEDGRQGFIDLLWKGIILIEFKSRGKDLDKAHKQAKDYFPALKDAELPRYILVSDFENFRLYDLEEDITIEFKLADLVHNVQHFGFIAGYQKQVYKEQDPVNIKAAELMGRLHDRLEEIGYEGHNLEVYLVRLLFCLFAEDTTIFLRQEFQNYIEQRTNADGSDLASKLQELFQVLNTPPEKRYKNIDEQLNSFPYVNGKLFEEPLAIASFDSKMRQALLDCCYLDWSQISPGIFGSMFQSVMNPAERRNLGAHYTSEKNILKLIKPLFLDDLWKEFESIKSNSKKLNEFHKRLSTLTFLDPACGCGNFLVITYRELRLLEIAILRALNKTGQGFLDVREIIWLDVDMMYGIEYEEFPARIAEVAMWLMDHQMNMLISNEFGQYFARLPLKKAATIVHGDALETDWESVIPKNKLSYIIGNPPFIGSKIMTAYQRNQIATVFDNAKGTGVMDYVTGWYIKAAKYIQGTKIKAAFVSTNSIVQGEQTAILWGQMFNKYNIKIHFAHRTFKWSNEARGNAAVYCVIIGFANYDTNDKLIFEYEDIKGEAHEVKAKNINAYLVDAKEVLIEKRSKPLCNVPKMSFGNMPLDGGHLLLSDEEKNEFITKEPLSEKYIKPLISASEFLNGKKRWCLWLVNSTPSELKAMPEVLNRIEGVKKFRLASVAPSTQKFAATPALFRDRNEPETYILVPSTSSENRTYIPMGYFSNYEIANNSCHTIPGATLYHFGILTSTMHMAWVKTTCGRLESRFRYSNEVVYNNYPWPENPSDKQVTAIEKAAQKVLDVRAQFADSSLADLYHPLTMPPALVKAHNDLDKKVDLAYRPQPFTGEAKRMEYLFELYEKYTADLFTKEKPKRGGKGSRIKN